MRFKSNCTSILFSKAIQNKQKQVKKQLNTETLPLSYLFGTTVNNE